MAPKLKLLLHFLLAMQLVSEAPSLVEFKNIKCEAVDTEFCTFDYCHLKSVNRTYKYISLRAKMLKLPITDAKVNAALYQRLNGYKPFLYNITVDCCKFFKNQKSSPVASFIYDSFKGFSNLNHSCPYNHDMVLDKLSAASVNHRVTNILPFPEGEYMLNFNWISHGSIRAVLKVYFALT
ncbi:uncharacterized protein LOC119549570 [Drosophila subpulchrella]|uniref:uncharacterized protein LOC119549570 n=1 Tax=Drosophila subpulchrella TaxID=1486046 RepID=UPI0018A166D9|nr:uncharacterized protein LOC119549570 [Drosophila subpulchrella]